ncbi:N-acetylmuramoyl-L-alanine amidase-like domain-containing protein [Legionella lytica]|uniref:N-acetylmuramoyl-L-alanine amidase-like domain-containing protein n=1 Tax=Legionella lytica TaxID=96232 RepID=A0ABW8D8P2_9GAMM
MKYTSAPLRKFALLIGFLTCTSSHAFDSSTTEKQANSSIEELYHKLNRMPNISMAGRIDWISKHFIGMPYVLGSLGEGPKARYDQFPQYRVDAFDCDTYVNTVVALALANSLPSFQQCMQKMRYSNGKVSYIQRTHFTGLDWNQYHQQEGIFKDITQMIKNKNNQAVAQMATATIDKPNWYAYKTIQTIRLQNANKAEQEKRLEELKTKGAKLEIRSENVPYLPLTSLFPKQSKPDLQLFAQIPNGAIIEIVRPNWNVKDKIGTSLNISHLGFAVWKDKVLYFRQASSEYGKVVEVSLVDYLKDALKSPTIKGVNVQVIVPKQSPCSS